MHRFAFAFLFLLVYFSQSVNAQVDSLGTIEISGRIIDDSLEYALPSVHLWNESTRMGSISNESGEFIIKASIHDTLVFSSIGYASNVIVVSSSMHQEVLVRLKSIKYEIDELVVRRFRSYESFKYQVVHLELPESEVAELKSYINLTSTAVAIEVDRERAVKEKIETGRLGYISPLGNGIDRNKAFREKTLNLKHRQKVIHAKFNRQMVADITQLDGDELTEFIALCDYSDEYLYETDLYTILDDLHAEFNNYQLKLDTIPYVN